MVCAPTGAGKTAIAEAATLHFLGRGQRVIYTTPLKALSNQKLGEMRERFGCAPWGGASVGVLLQLRTWQGGVRAVLLCGLPREAAAVLDPPAEAQRSQRRPPERLPAPVLCRHTCRQDGAGLQTGDASLNVDAPVVVRPCVWRTVG